MSIDSEGYFVRIVQFPHRITIVTSVFMSDCSQAPTGPTFPGGLFRTLSSTYRGDDDQS